MTTEQLRSVLSTVAAACETEGFSLDELIECRRRRGRYGTSGTWPHRLARVCARVRQADNPPSYPKIAAVLGTGHSTVHDAVRRFSEKSR